MERFYAADIVLIVAAGIVAFFIPTASALLAALEWVEFPDSTLCGNSDFSSPTT